MKFETYQLMFLLYYHYTKKVFGSVIFVPSIDYVVFLFGFSHYVI